jgi:hypothetical protein
MLVMRCRIFAIRKKYSRGAMGDLLNLDYICPFFCYP